MHLFSSVCRENEKLIVYIQEFFIFKRKQNKKKRKVILVCNLQFAFFNLQFKKDKDRQERKKNYKPIRFYFSVCILQFACRNYLLS